MKKLKFIMLSTIILLYGIFVGSPLIDNTKIINLIVIFVSFIYLIYKIIKDKDYKIIRRNVDIYVVLLVISSFISIIFQSYANLESSIEYIIKYASLLGIYIIFRDATESDKESYEWIKNTIIISGIILFLIGLDCITFNFTNKFIEFSKNVQVQNDNNRFIGIFGYANTSAIIMLIISILSINQNLKNTKLIYNISIFLSLTAIIMSYSRAVWILTIITYIIYLFYEKSRKNEYIETMISTGIISIIYSFLAIRIIGQTQYLKTWLLLLVFIVIMYFNKKILKKIRKYTNTIDKKIWIVILIVIVFGLINLFNVLKKYDEPLELFKSVNIKKESTFDVINVKPNTKYVYEFDINSKADYDINDLYEIQVCERNKYDDILLIHNIEIGNFVGTKKIEFETTQYTHKILIRFYTKNHVAQRGLTINKLTINGEKKILKYKYLPTAIVEKVEDISLKTISVSERCTYMKDACKLINQNMILGIGADGWKDRQKEVQDYSNFTNEIHSYVLEIFSEFGIVGFIALIGIIVEIAKKILSKNKIDENQFALLLSICILLIHSFIDFDMSFMYILVVFFILLAINDFKEINYKKIEIIMRITIIGIMLVALYFDVNILYNENILKNKNPYSEEYEYDKIVNGQSSITNMISRRKYHSHIKILRKLESEIDLTDKQQEEIFNIIKQEEKISRCDIFEKIDRVEYIYEKIRNINNEDLKSKYKELLKEEINKANKLLDDPEVCRLGLEQIDYYKEKLKNVIDM